MRAGIAAGAVAWGLLAMPAAHATDTFSYVTPDAPGNTLSLVPGQSKTLRVYLLETLTNGSPSALNDDGGLFGGGFSLTRTAGTSVTLGGISGATASGQPFAGGSFAADPADSPTRQAGDNAVSTSATAGPTTDANGEVFLGLVSVTAGSARGSSTLVLANYTYPSTQGGYTQTYGGTPSGGQGFDLDVTRNTSGSNYNYSGAADHPTPISVNVAAPEPSALGLLACTGLLAMRRRSRATRRVSPRGHAGPGPAAFRVLALPARSALKGADSRGSDLSSLIP